MPVGLRLRGLVGLERTGSSMAPSLNGHGRATRAHCQQAVSLPSLHLSTSPPLPSSSSQTSQVAGAARSDSRAEPSAVSNGRADLTVHTQQAHARAPLHASGSQRSSVQHRLYLVTAPSAAVDVVAPQTSTAVLCSRFCLLARHWHRTLNPCSLVPDQVFPEPHRLPRSPSINNHRAHRFFAPGFGLHCI